jgi:Methyltransferase domain
MAVQVSKKVKVKLERGAPDDKFVSTLARVNLTTAEAVNKVAKGNAEFRNLVEETLATGGRSNYIQICAPIELYALTRLCNPKHIVEVGVSAGVSSAFFLHALKSNGSGVLHSIDLPERQSKSEPESARRWGSWALPPGRDPGWGIPKYLKKAWDLRLGKSSDVLPDLIKELPRVDLFLYDVPYEIDEAINDFRVVDRKLRKGSVILADNCQVPITWWARRRMAKIYQRKGSGLRGFYVT